MLLTLCPGLTLLLLKIVAQKKWTLLFTRSYLFLKLGGLSLFPSDTSMQQVKKLKNGRIVPGPAQAYYKVCDALHGLILAHEHLVIPAAMKKLHFRLSMKVTWELRSANNKADPSHDIMIMIRYRKNST